MTNLLCTYCRKPLAPDEECILSPDQAYYHKACHLRETEEICEWLYREGRMERKLNESGEYVYRLRTPS